MPFQRCRMLVVACCATLLGACPGEPEGESKISQEARDLYQDQRLTNIEERLDAIDSRLRRLVEDTSARAEARNNLEPRFQPPATAEDRPIPDQQEDAVELISISARPGQSNPIWTTFGWKAALRNAMDRPVSFSLKVKFLDADGYQVDELIERITLSPAEERTVTGAKLVEASVALRVSNVAGELIQ